MGYIAAFQRLPLARNLLFPKGSVLNSVESSFGDGHISTWKRIREWENMHWVGWQVAIYNATGKRAPNVESSNEKVLLAKGRCSISSLAYPLSGIMRGVVGIKSCLGALKTGQHLLGDVTTP